MLTATFNRAGIANPSHVPRPREGFAICVRRKSQSIQLSLRSILWSKKLTV